MPARPERRLWTRGSGLRGSSAGDPLECGGGLLAGTRQAGTTQGASSRNSPRVAARLQYDFFDTEKGYTYVGTNRGARKILAVGAWGDTQEDFEAYGADVMADIPIRKDAVTVEADSLLYDGGKQLQQIVGSLASPLLPRHRRFFTPV